MSEFYIKSPIETSIGTPATHIGSHIVTPLESHKGTLVKTPIESSI